MRLDILILSLLNVDLSIIVTIVRTTGKIAKLEMKKLERVFASLHLTFQLRLRALNRLTAYVLGWNSESASVGFMTTL
jgi:hypothetical protein